MIEADGGRRQTALAFAAVTSVFFGWGFITSNNDPLIAALRAAFDLPYAEALLTQIIFFLAYGLLSLPAAWIGARLGLVDTMLGALLIMAAGCLLVSFTTGLAAFPPILAALFVVAAGFTVLQVAGNPLAAGLGTPERSHFRLSFAQALNSLGVVVGVHFGSQLMLGRAVSAAADRQELLAAVGQAYRLMAALPALLFFLLLAFRSNLLRAAGWQPSAGEGGLAEVLRSRWALFGSAAIGLYVGAEVSIGSIMINFLNQPHVLGLPLDQAGRHLANFYWGGALVGRIVGTLLLARVRAPHLLTACSTVSATLCAVVFLDDGPVSGYAALAVGLFNSIMFPTIFSITLERSGVPAGATSGLLCLAIVAGAVLPLAVGAIADRFGLSNAFIIPLAAYLVITFFALAARRPHRIEVVS